MCQCSVLPFKAANRPVVGAPEPGRILIVRHGKNRGPRIRFRCIRPEYFDPMLADFQRRYSEMRGRISVWETGTQLPAIRGVKAILFLLQDPLHELYPECYDDCMALAQQGRLNGITLVNPPDAMSNTIKSVQAAKWRAVGLPTPRHLPFRDAEELRRAASFVRFPAFLRADHLHVQSGMRLIRSREALLALDPATIVFPGSLAEFVDIREGYRRTAPDSEYARFYHKKRAIVVGNRVRYAHLFFGAHPIVSSLSSTFGHYKSLNPVRRIRGRMGASRHIELDNEFVFGRGEPDPFLFVRAARALGLDWVAIDYSSLADGGVMLWEANAHFSLHLWPFDVLRRPRRVAERHRLTHDMIHEYFQFLLTRKEASEEEMLC